MKVVIFAGGLGTRLAEETDVRPKPMVEIGGKPIHLAHHENLQHLVLMSLLFVLVIKAILLKNILCNITCTILI